MGAEGAGWLQARGLTKAYGGVLALADATLELRAGELRGLVGANGAGKSTLVKILTGMVTPTRGEVLVGGRRLRLGRPQASLAAGIASVPQELEIAPGMTVAENIMLGHEPCGRLGRLRPLELRRAARRVLDSLSLPIHEDARAGELTLIEQRLVMIARALSRDARLVIFDEPTATVSPLEVELLLRTVRTLTDRGVAVLYVSHHLGEVERICDAVTVLRDGRVVAELPGEQATHDRLVELLVAGTGRRQSAREARSEPGVVILSARGLADERLRGVDVDLRAGEIVGVAGLVGSGARELLLALAGALPHRGRIQLGAQVLRPGSTPAAVSSGVAFLPGDRSLGTFPSSSVRHNVSLSSLPRHAAGPFVRARRERAAVASVLRRVGLSARPEQRIAELSGGNQQKALVARAVASEARVLLLDDPTAGVDVLTRPEIHAQIVSLARAGAAVLLVSTDLEELVQLSDRILVLERGAVVDELRGPNLTPALVLAAMTRSRLQPSPTEKEVPR
ncbi:MAG TPA: sugar ABC transporter ATP-binding protein [Gaiellaceae bacterium]|nr:sugar ABC transporter ATP-binding protein [Gaiellaceae bacterium]